MGLNARKIPTFAQGSLSSEQPLGNPLYPIPDYKNKKILDIEEHIYCWSVVQIPVYRGSC